MIVLEISLRHPLMFWPRGKVFFFPIAKLRVPLKMFVDDRFSPQSKHIPQAFTHDFILIEF